MRLWLVAPVVATPGGPVWPLAEAAQARWVWFAETSQLEQTMSGPEPVRTVATCHGVLGDLEYRPGMQERVLTAPFVRLELFAPGGGCVLRAWAALDAEDRASIRAGSPGADIYWRAIVGPDGTYVQHE